MKHQLHPRDPGLGGMLTTSLAFHLVLFFALVAASAFRTALPASAPVYYVDVIDLPVASPQAGTPGVTAAPNPAPPAPAPPTPATPPAPKAAAAPSRAPAVQKMQAAKAAPSSGESADEAAYRESMAKLARREEASHEEEALSALRNRVAQHSASRGIPGGTGTQVGSDYPSYILSRLRDAFAATIIKQSQNPETLILLTIDRNGRLKDLRIERSSGDRLFDQSVTQAVHLAEKNFRPPPSGRDFTYRFRFKPEGVAKK